MSQPRRQGPDFLGFITDAQLQDLLRDRPRYALIFALIEHYDNGPTITPFVKDVEFELAHVNDVQLECIYRNARAASSFSFLMEYLRSVWAPTARQQAERLLRVDRRVMGDMVC